MRLAAVSLAEVRRAIESDLRGPSSTDALLIAITSEHLRAAVVLEASEPFNDGRYPVPTVRLTLSLEARIAPFRVGVAASEDATLEQLNHLSSLSDLVRCNGKWYAAPLRLVGIDEATVLIVGGGPVHSFPARVRTEVETVGRARIMKLSERTRDFVSRLPTQALEDWLGLPCHDVRSWAREFEKKCLRAMTQTCEMDEVRVWAKHRWVPFEQYCGVPGVLLYRRSVSFFGNAASAYGMAKVHASKGNLPQLLGVCEIQKNDARRMQGALNDTSRRKRIWYIYRGNLILLRLPHPLPAPESAFLSLGWTAAANDKAGLWPKEFYFSSRLLPLIQRSLDMLGYELVEKVKREK